MIIGQKCDHHEVFKNYILRNTDDIFLHNFNINTYIT